MSNFVTFASLLLLFSTIVLAFPAENDRIEPPGSFHKADIKSIEINDLAKKLVAKQFVASSGSGCTQKVNRILNAKTKVVAGQIVNMELEICPDACTNDSVKTNQCKVCTVEAWEKSWEDFLQINKFDCGQ